MKSREVKLVAGLGLALAVASGASAATILDLTAAGSSGSIQVSAGGPSALFMQVDPQPTGTGVIDPFVRIQGSPTEAGYNTDGQIEFQTKDQNQWTHSITTSDVPVVTINGVKYREFMLDINEKKTGTGRLLSMNQLQVFLGTTGDLTGYPSFGGDAYKIYDMDTGPTGDRYVQMDYSNGSGSGSGDLFVYIPDALFVGPNQYVYLYSAFGLPSSSDAGFEEWAVRTGTSNPAPPPAAPTPAALGGGLVGMGMLLASRRGRGAKQ